MARVSFASIENAPVVSTADGVETRALFAGEHPIHLHIHRLAPRARVNFTADAADDLLYVWEGSVAAGGMRMEARSSAIVEHGASLSVSAGEGGAALARFSARRGLNERTGGHVHLLPSERVPRNAHGMSLHADSQCPTCQLWLHENDFTEANREIPLHYHSHDEVMFVRAGAVRLGNSLFRAGAAVAIKANTKYSFATGPEGLSFANFRDGASTSTSGDGSVVSVDVERWTSLVGKPAYLVPLGSS